MMTHEELCDVLRHLHARVVRFERTTHLGHPVRSYQVYGHVIAALASSGTEYTPDRYGFVDLRDRLLAASRREALDRDQVAARANELIAWVNQRIAEARP